MAVSVTTLTRNVWTKVLTNVTYLGLVCIIDQDGAEPSEYQVALVATGAGAPAVGFTGGITFKDGFRPDNSVASDYYVKPLNKAGKVVIYT
jgi:hypothetical protein